MAYETSLSELILSNYKEIFLPIQVNPTEFMVWHSLKVSCLNLSGDKNVAQLVSVASVADLSGISRETVRRSLYKLASKGLTKRINELWIFNQPAKA